MIYRTQPNFFWDHLCVRWIELYSGTELNAWGIVSMTVITFEFGERNFVLGRVLYMQGEVIVLSTTSMWSTYFNARGKYLYAWGDPDSLRNYKLREGKSVILFSSSSLSFLSVSIVILGVVIVSKRLDSIFFYNSWSHPTLFLGRFLVDALKSWTLWRLSKKGVWGLVLSFLMLFQVSFLQYLPSLLRLRATIEP